MQQLGVRRLTAAESDQERAIVTKYDDHSDRSFPFPRKIREKDLRERLGIAKATLHKYRKLALVASQEYLEASEVNNPGYLAGLNNIPDKPPFSCRQAEILRDISLLFDKYRNGEIVRAFLEQFNNNNSN